MWKKKTLLRRLLPKMSFVQRTSDNTVRNLLFQAVSKSNNESVVRALIDAGADVNITNDDGETPLFYAVQQSNNESVVRALIDAGADINKSNNGGETALFYTVQQSNNESMVRALIDGGANVNKVYYEGKTALLYAVEQCNESVIQALIDGGADVNKTDRYGETALFYAVQQSNNESVVRALIDAGADVNKVYYNGGTALFYAVKLSNNESVVRALIDAGADVNKTNNNNGTALFYAVKLSNNEIVVRALIDAGANVNKVYYEGKTALFFAVQQCNESVVRALIDAGADVNKASHYSSTALFYAVQQSNNESVVRALIDAGADVNVTYSNGETALFYAVKQSNNESMVRALMDAGADVNKSNNGGETALFYCVKQSNHESVVRALIDAGADVNKSNNSGESALFYAVQQRYNESTVRALIDGGADVNKTNDDGETALFIAVRQSNNESVVRALIDSGADVSKTNKDGATALFYAVQQSNNESVVLALIVAGADVNKTNKDGETALFHAVQQSNNESVVRALIDAGADVNKSNNDGETPLFYAVKQSNNESVVRALIDAGAFINVKDTFGRTPLFYALHDPVVARILLDKGGNKNLHLKDNCNCNVWRYYIERRIRSDNQMIFLLNAFDFRAFSRILHLGVGKAEFFQTIMSILLSDILLVLSYDHGKGLKRYSITFEYISKFAKELAKEYMDENDSHQQTENLMAILKKKVENPEKISEVLRLLVELGADPNSGDSHGNTALHYATRLAWMGVPQETVMEICHQLEKLGVQLNVRNHQNQTPLLFCLSSGDITKIKQNVHQLSAIKTIVNVSGFLLKHGSSIDERSRSGETVFHLILKLLHQGLELKDRKVRQDVLHEMIKLLQLFPPGKIARAKIIKIPDNNFNTPLHLWASLALPSPQDYAISVTEGQAFEQFLKVIFKYLFDCGAQLNVRNTDDQTPLHWCKTWSAVKLLLDAGANPNDVDSSRRSPLLLVAKRIQSIKNPASLFFPDIPESEDPKTFWKTAIEKGLDPWTADKNGESVLSSLVECESFVLAKALVDVACEENFTQSKEFTDSLLNAICNDKSTRAKWKTNLVQNILKSTRCATTAVEPLRLCCKNVLQALDEQRLSRGRMDEEARAEFEKMSVHCQIIKMLRLYGIGDKSCLDMADTYPELQDVLTKPLDVDKEIQLIPWASVSRRYHNCLAKVARRKECDMVHDVFWYHKDNIASGAFGSVFVGINEKDGREVAIKRIEKLRMKRPKDKREVTNLTALADCEQVVRYLCFFEEEKFAYVVLELTEGNLDEYLTDGSTFDAGKSTQLCEDVVKGLKYLHQQDIIHRDLKPGNILYKTHPKLCLKIADFGLSRRIDGTATTVYSTNAGTRCWIAPEVLKSKKDPSKSSDLFSCGLLLHCILSPKKHPFSPVDCASKGEYQIAHETEANIMNDNMEGWDVCVSPEANHLIRNNMLESNEINRPTAQQALDHPLFWSNTKKIDFLIAVGNQSEFEYSRTGKLTCLTAVEADVEKNFSTIVVHGEWNDPRYNHMPVINTEMEKKRSYDTHSAVELVRLIRNAHAHVSEVTRPTAIRKMILEDFVFLEYFPSLVMEVYKVVITHGWHQTRDEIKYAMDK